MDAYKQIANKLETLDRQVERLKVLEGGGGVKVVAVKYAEFTGTQSVSVAASSHVAITDLSINHAIQNTSNRVILLGQGGILANTRLDRGNAGLAFGVDGLLITVGTSLGNRVPTSAGGYEQSSSNGDPSVTASRFIASVYSPGTTGSKTYTLRAVNIDGLASTLLINKGETDEDNGYIPRGASTLILIEVSG